ncbi:TniQ family protein [Paraburkholderia sp. A1RI_3L]|uniref:TnsD family Tn7-like transposition protein n=1 Tax=Paraburkholderia TaxID=1822464 RepID=UPI003B797D99
MAVDLDPPYEDEALYSVIARYFRSVRVSHYSAALRSIFGSASHLSPGGPHNLDYLAAQCRHVWPWSAAEIADRLTVYPYFAALLTNEIAERLLKQMREGTGDNRVGQALMVGVRLRYCPECLADDCQAGRPGYWRRQHLLPGVLMCSKHKQWLVEVSPDRSRHHYLVIPNSNGSLAQPVELSLTSGQADACMRVSQMSQYLLHNAVSVLPERLASHFRESARAAGFAHGPDRIRTADLTHALVKHFGKSFLIHIDAFPKCSSNWVASALRGTLPMGHAHKTVLLAEFLSSLQRSTCHEAWPVCPHARPGSEHSVNLRTRVEEGYIAKCSCGLSFKYSGVLEGIPQHVKPTRFAFLTDDVARLRSDGWTYKAIATRFHIAQGTARKLCTGPASDDGPSPSPETRANRIAQWGYAVREFGSVRAAGRVREALYLWMRRYAREFL